MSLELKVQQDMKAAMLAKNKVQLEALRAIKSEILLAKTSGASSEVTDADVLKIIQKIVKQHNESAELYKQNGRQELADNEIAEAKYMEVYLPKQMTEEELGVKIKAIVASLGASQPSDMGKVMGVASKQLAGQAEGRAIAAAVKKILSGN